ncbi:hypothetical protein ACH5RR_035490 [Cinchona calisaya]|uniref:Uncharacterized protein n=1 Tax=Cinchona calisaya TaxID=153742 RepID=A0ABD2Y2S1_9GENT
MSTSTCSTSLRQLYIGQFHQPLLMLRHFMSYLSIESFENAAPLPLLGPPKIYSSCPPNYSLEDESLVKTQKGREESIVESNKQQINEHFSSSYMASNVNYHHHNTSDHSYSYRTYGSGSFGPYGPHRPYYPPPPRSYMGFTENLSPTYFSSGDPCLDFFFHVVPDTPQEEIKRYLELAWEKNALTALKLVFNLRGIRGTGKGDREGFYASALWLHENHPKTLAFNLPSMAEFGYFKDMLEILYRLLEGADVREKEWKEIQQNKWEKGDEWYLGRPKRNVEGFRIIQGKKGLERYNNDSAYRFLHNRVSSVFAETLKKDLEDMKAGKLRNISLAAKWCPSLTSCYDRLTLLCESIGRRLFPRDLPEYQNMEEAHYAYEVRNRLRKEVLVPLRKVLQIPEVFMCANQWNEIRYSRVPPIAMKNYKGLFFEHDPERFQGYLDRVKSGKAKIAAGALLPHEIIESLKSGEAIEVVELQWQRIVDDLSAMGKLNNCLAICDVSGSMHGTPLDVSVALGLLVSELNEEPWKGTLITFSSHPQLQLIEGDGLLAKVDCLQRMYWEMNTNFQRVFDKILEVAKAGNLSEDQMIKRLFVFSDMEFDQASLSPWETDYEAICRKFNENGYTSVPEIVFWNLRDSQATPVPSHQKGVALVSGFSKNLLKLFLEKGGVLTPEDTMELAIAGKEYSKLVVVD